MAQVFDTIIIGAGWSGAVAARDLARAGRSVLVLEARDRVGGRARTWTSKAGDKVDLGCSWIHGYNEGNPARAIAEGLKIPAHLPKPVPGAIYGSDGALPSDVAGKLGASLGAAKAAFSTPHPAPGPKESLASALFGAESPLTTSGVDKKVVESFARTLEVPLGLKLENASLRWAGWEAATGYQGSDAAPEGGYEALVTRVLDDATDAGAKVELNAKVSSIKDGKSITVTTPSGSYLAQTVICTIPLGTLKVSTNIFNPPLSPRYLETVAGVHVGVLEKLLLRYDTAWWPNATSTGGYTFLPTGPTPTSSSSLLDVFNGSTLITANFASGSLPGPTPTLLTYLSDTPARLLLQHSAEDVAAAFHEFLQARFGVKAPAPTEVELTNWLTDELSLGATTTPTIVSEGERSPMDFKELSRPTWEGRLGFAGEHTDMDNRGSVAGAVVSGQREAARVERLLKKLGA